MSTPRQFTDERFQRGLEVVLGAAYRRAADIGEVLATAGRIQDGDADSWLCEWTATGGTAWAAAGRAERGGHRSSALAHYLRAGTYYATALHLVTYRDTAVSTLDLWRRQRECWDRAVRLLPVPGERVRIPYEQTSLPAYFFRAPGSAAGEARPLIVLNNGSDAVTASMWVQGGAAASERGFHWMTFDGPGQEAALFEQGICFRPDWEAVLTPVFDALAARPDVDPERVAVIGVGQAGFWVPRALAFEHRFAAAVVDPGVVDVAAPWIDALPAAARAELLCGAREQFDREMRVAHLFAPERRALLEARAVPYGSLDGSVYDLFERVRGYRLGDEADLIRTPLLVLETEGDQPWAGQSRALYERLHGTRRLAEFTAAEGAAGAGAPLAPALRETRIFDWLDGFLSRASPTPTRCSR